jgi:hypothetical protein
VFLKTISAIVNFRKMLHFATSVTSVTSETPLIAGMSATVWIQTTAETVGTPATDRRQQRRRTANSKVANNIRDDSNGRNARK